MAKTDRRLRFQPAGGTPPALTPGSQTLRIERLAADGRGIGFCGGRTWFVEGALPGELVSARASSARGVVTEARVLQVLQASAERQQAPCAQAGRCGGCSLQHLSYGRQLELKQQGLADQLQRQAGLRPQQWAAPLFGPALGYRRRARIAVHWRAKSRHLAVGFRALASRDIVELTDCPVLTPPLQPLARGLPSALRGLRSAAGIGHVELFQGTATALLVRHLVDLPGDDLQRLQDFCAGHGAQLWLQGRGEAHPVDPTQQLGYRLPAWDLTLGCQPDDFVQVNAAVNDAMLAQAVAWLAPSPGQRLLDLFCGLGNFSLPLARSYGQVVGVEGVPAMVRRAQDNARRAALDNAQFFQADLSKPLTPAGWTRERYDALLLDPPREGARQMVESLSLLNIPRLLYVSCNPATLARDAGLLGSQGYRLRRAGLLDMFPQTSHSEAMLLFEKSAV